MWPKKTALSRITDDKQIIPEIEGLRFLAIVLVIFSHINNILLKHYPASLQYNADTGLGILLEQCGAGVQVFFFISGFILSVPFLQHHVYQQKKLSVKHYYYRRFTRIEPPYLISLLLLLPASAWLLHEKSGYLLAHFTASALYVHNIMYNEISRVNPVAWSLEIEIQFYILFPLMAACLFVKNHVWRRMLLVTFFIASAMLASIYQSWILDHHLGKSLLTYAPLFIAGIIAAEIYLSATHYFHNGKRYLYDVAGMLALYSCIKYSGFVDPRYKILLLAGYLTFFTAVFKGKLLNKFFTTHWVVLTGGMCYSIYLLHYAIIYFFQGYITRHLYTYHFVTDIIIQSLLLMPVIWMISSMFFMYCERPFMDIRWPEKLVQYINRSRH